MKNILKGLYRLDRVNADYTGNFVSNPVVDSEETAALFLYSSEKDSLKLNQHIPLSTNEKTFDPFLEMTNGRLAQQFKPYKNILLQQRVNYYKQARKSVQKQCNSLKCKTEAHSNKEHTHQPVYSKHSKSVAMMSQNKDQRFILALT